MNKKGDYKIPFDKKGNQLDYPAPDYGNPGSGTVWIDNHVFGDTLTLHGYGRGRSSVTFIMSRPDGRTVSVFVSDFYDMATKMVHGEITGVFTFAKKGANYGCKLAPL